MVAFNAIGRIMRLLGGPTVTQLNRFVVVSLATALVALSTPTASYAGAVDSITYTVTGGTFTPGGPITGGVVRYHSVPYPTAISTPPFHIV